jgi:hypothetical protein
LMKFKHGRGSMGSAQLRLGTWVPSQHSFKTEENHGDPYGCTLTASKQSGYRSSRKFPPTEVLLIKRIASHV